MIRLCKICHKEFDSVRGKVICSPECKKISIKQSFARYYKTTKYKENRGRYLKSEKGKKYMKSYHDKTILKRKQEREADLFLQGLTFGAVKGKEK